MSRPLICLLLNKAMGEWVKYFVLFSLHVTCPFYSYVWMCICSSIRDIIPATMATKDVQILLFSAVSLWLLSQESGIWCQETLPFQVPAYPILLMKVLWRNQLEIKYPCPSFFFFYFSYQNWSGTMDLIDSRQDSLDGWPARRKAATYTGQHKHRRNADRHPRLEWEPNPRSQPVSGRRHFMP
jgi:hypothetical protein